MAAPIKPLMLKDFLELDENADSCSGFQCIPRRCADPDCSTATVRLLLEAELVRPRSKGALTKISNAINNVAKNLPISSPLTGTTGTKTRRSLSQKVAGTGTGTGRSFWKRSAKEGRAVADDKVRVKDTVRLNTFEMCGERRSLYFPSPYSASSCSSCSPSRHSSSSASDFLLSSTSSFDCPEYLGEEAGRDASSRSPTRMIAGVADAALSGNHQETKEIIKNEEPECCGYQSEEEKEQQSPVSVMNFPFQEEEDNDEDDGNNEAISSCFEQNLANIERTKQKLLENIRRFESLAALDPVDHAESFTNFEDYVPSNEKNTTDSCLIGRLRSVGPHKKLLMDFFEEELTWTDNVEELLISAEKWILDEGHLMDSDHGKVQIKNMERNGRWRCFKDEKEDLAANVEVQILGSLVEDLVLDLLS